MSDVWRRFLKHRLAVGGLGLIVALILLALGSAVAPHDPLRQDLPHALAGPPSSFPGTDEFGRCILSRVFFGARLSPLVRHRHRHRGHRGHSLRARRRLLSAPRRARDADHGRAPRFSEHSPRHRHRGRARSEPRQCHDRGGRALDSQLRAARPLHGALPQGARVRAGRGRPRRFACACALPAHPPKQRLAASSSRPCRWPRPSCSRRSCPSRPGRPAAHAQWGRW